MNPQKISQQSVTGITYLEKEPHSEDGIQWKFEPPLEFTNAFQDIIVGKEIMTGISKILDGIQAMTVGGWFYCRRSGEQTFFCRGIPEVANLGERMFPPNNKYINFCLGTDQRDFFFGTIHGNGSMPFPHVTLNEVFINTWNQLVVVKDAQGYQKFYQNGTLIHTDHNAASAGSMRPFRETAEGEKEPIRLAVPMGGMIAEAWVFPRELTADEIKADYLAKKDKYKPAHPGQPILLREMNSHPAVNLWREPITSQNWHKERQRIMDGVMKVLGPFPDEKVPLEPQIISEEDCGSYIRRKISIAVQPENNPLAPCKQPPFPPYSPLIKGARGLFRGIKGDNRMPAYLLIPKNIKERVPAIICFYGTTSGAGKETTVGLSGRAPGSPPVRNYSFALDMVEAGFAAFAADYIRDGERIKPGRQPYDTTDFYQQFPDWSIHGKDVWDNSRAIDYLQTLDFVDADKIGMTGHSYGGHSTIFAAALEPRIKVAVANGPVSDFLHHGMHWGVPKGARNSQSLPAMIPYVLDHTLPIPVTFYEFTALIAPRPLLVGQAVGERRPMEEENYAAVKQVYQALGYADRVLYHWYAGDHDYPPEARKAAVDWFRRWL